MTNIDKRLIVRRREVYGVAKFYPMNTTAKLFAEIAGTKTLTEQTIGLAQHLGFTLVATADELPVNCIDAR